MRRREFIALLGGATAAWPLAAGAQQASADPSPIKIAVFNFELDDFSGGAGIAGDNAADVTQLDRATSDARRLIAESGRYSLVDVSSVEGDAVKGRSLRQCNGCEAAIALKRSLGTLASAVIAIYAHCSYKAPRRIRLPAASPLRSILIGYNAPAWTQEPDASKTEFLSSCAACHGADGKGNGPMTAELKKAPPDLTTLAKKNNGVFPIDAVYEMIDGRAPIGAHGTREMPIWGFRFNPLYVAPLSNIDTNVSRNAEFIVRNRILALVEYLNRIQEK